MIDRGFVIVIALLILSGILIAYFIVRKQVRFILQQSEEKYRRLIENSFDLICELDMEGKFLFINKSFSIILGYSRDELMKMNVLDLIYSRDKRKFLHDIPFLSESKIFIHEYRIRSKAGEWLWLENIISVYRTGSGEKRVLVISRDIDERKKYEKILRESEIKYRMLYTSMNEGMALYEILFNHQGDAYDYRILDVNSSFERLTGLKRDEVIGRKGLKLNPLLDENRLEEYYRVAYFGEPMHFESYSEQLEKNFQITVFSPKKGYFATLFSDITDQKTAEKALRNSEERLRLALESANEGLWDLNVVTGKAYFSPRYYTMLYYNPDELPGSYETFKNLLYPDDVIPAEKKLQEALRKKEGQYDIEFRMMRKDGEIKWIQSRGKVVERDRQGNPVRMIGTHTDITERKIAEEKLLSSLQEKETLLKEIHHRVKNNLQIISSLLHIQEKYIRDKKSLEIFHGSQNRIKTMALIHEKLYRSENLSKVNFKEYLNSLVNNFFYSYSIDCRKIKTELYVDDIFLSIDDAIPCGLLINELISNALKHAFPGNMNGMIIIRFIDNGDFYLLTVKDNGVGLPADFNPDVSDTLGMKLVSNLIEQMNGENEIIRNNGTEFRIKIRFSAENS